MEEKAALKRERLLSKPPENDNSAPVVSTGDNKPGDAAAMREALEAARDLLLPQCNGGTAFAKACGETVNKIMDALKEERTSDGNAAAMREALHSLVDVIEQFNGYHPLWWHNNAPGVGALKAAKTALSAPPRNCDVGTVEEQHVRFVSHCDRCDCPMGCVRRKSIAGVLDPRCGSILKCFIKWAQMPYEEGGAK